MNIVDVMWSNVDVIGNLHISQFDQGPPPRSVILKYAKVDPPHL